MKKFLEQLIAVSPMLRTVCLKAKHCRLITQNTLLSSGGWGGGSSFMENEGFPPVGERVV